MARIAGHARVHRLATGGGQTLTQEIGVALRVPDAVAESDRVSEAHDAPPARWLGTHHFGAAQAERVDGDGPALELASPPGAGRPEEVRVELHERQVDIDVDGPHDEPRPRDGADAGQPQPAFEEGEEEGDEDGGIDDGARAGEAGGGAFGHERRS